ncbi:hypothetical protein BC941DRAFT_442832 [Chlamydoabsidia padenii]|nr:hypothetical protein BC941DRAFT_442832 [Chlamydoabsidia padenii]
MSGLVVYHNPSCSKSRNAKTLLEQQQQAKLYELQVCTYKTSPPSRDTLEKLAQYLGLMEKEDLCRPWDVLLRPEAKNKAQGWMETWELLANDPALLERPFVIDWDHQRAALGRSVPGHPDLMTIEQLLDLYENDK